MPLAKRIISCLDVKDGRVVKGTNFGSLKLAGDPVELAKSYSEQGADEIVFLDISASEEKRKTRVDLARSVARALDIPFTIGGGISSVEDGRKVLSNGADKVSVNTAAVENPEIITDLAEIFGSQCVVVAIDAKRSASPGFTVCTYGGKKGTGIDALEWAASAERLGAGEILLTSIDRDGTKMGFDLELTHAVVSKVSIPVIASGGCGQVSDFVPVLKGSNSADAALAASIFHYGEATVSEVKERLREEGVVVRL